MRITGKHLGVDLSDEGLLIELEGSRDFLQLNSDQGKELFIFLEMIKTGSSVVVIHQSDHNEEGTESHRDSGQGYM